jgi:AraC-like DNA-binding protein
MPADEGITRWRDLVGRAPVALDVQVEPGAAFPAGIRVVGIDAVRLVLVRHPPLRLAPGPGAGRGGGPYLLLNVRGVAVVAQGGRTARLNPRDFTVVDGGRPFHGSHGIERGQCWLVVVPLDTLGLPVPRGVVRQVCAVRMPGQDGVGGLLGRHLLDLVLHPESYRPTDAPHLALVTVELVAALLGRQLCADGLSADRGNAACLSAVMTYIERNLTDPSLSPRTIARAQHVSTRTVHRLFQGTGTTLAAWIRHRRLQGCRRELAAAGRSVPVHVIAARWGFTDLSHFSRGFRAEYGVTPSHVRERPASA